MKQVQLSYEPHPSQLEIHKNRARFRVVVCGRRFGKTTLAVNELLVQALKTPGSLNWYVAPTYKQAKQIAWEMLQKYTPKEVIAKKNETELSLKLYNGARIELKGADSPDSLRGVGVSFLVVDEVASIRNWGWLWSEVLRATLTDTAGRAIFIGTPKGFNHFHDLYLAGQAGDPSYKSWRFTTYDNPTIPSGEIDEAKKELSDDFFSQEYMADFRKYTGLVYKDFDHQVNIIRPFDIPEEWQVYRGVDFGSTNPTAVPFIAVDSDDNWFVCDEHYETGQTIDHHAGLIQAKPLSRRVEASYGDPSGAQWINEFNQRGVYITPATKEMGTSQLNWVRFGIEKVAERLKKKYGHTVVLPANGEDNSDKILHDAPRLFVFSTCTNTIHEFETYRWKEKTEGVAQDLNEPDQPEKSNDHAMDALRYFAVSYGRMPDMPWDLNRNDAQFAIGEI